MPAPTVTVATATSPPPRASLTDTGVAGIVGISATGPAGTTAVPRLVTTADRLLSQSDWVSRYGAGSLALGRLATSVDYDVVEEFFRDGGASLYYARVVGPSPVKATLNLAGTGTSLVVTANEYGDVANTKKIQVINGPIGGAGTRVVKLLENDGTTLIDQTAEIATQAGFAGIVLGASSNVPVTITLGGGTGLPTVVAATVLAGGTDDRSNITQTQVDVALANLAADLGPMNVAAPNWQTSACGLSLLAHGKAYNRFAACDTVNGASKATLLSHASALQGGVNASYGMLLAPWVQIPALATGGTARSIPASALQLAKFAQTDASDSPNQSAAGAWGTSNYATGVTSTFARTPQGTSDADNLSDAGVNLVVFKDGAVKVYDNLTLVLPAGAEGNYIQVPTVRYRMWKVAQFTQLANAEQFSKINRNTLAAWKTSMEGLLLVDFINGDLFPDDADPQASSAFNVDVVTPNTTTTMNSGQMNASVAVRPVKGARLINLTISTVAMTQPVS